MATSANARAYKLRGRSANLEDTMMVDGRGERGGMEESLRGEGITKVEISATRATWTRQPPVSFLLRRHTHVYHFQLCMFIHTALWNAEIKQQVDSRDRHRIVSRKAASAFRMRMVKLHSYISRTVMPTEESLRDARGWERAVFTFCGPHP